MNDALDAISWIAPLFFYWWDMYWRVYYREEVDEDGRLGAENDDIRD